jgi:hypothetical protein
MLLFNYRRPTKALATELTLRLIPNFSDGCVPNLLWGIWFQSQSPGLVRGLFPPRAAVGVGGLVGGLVGWRKATTSQAQCPASVLLLREPRWRVPNSASRSHRPPYSFFGSPQASSMGKRSLRRLLRGNAGRAWSQTTGGRKKALTIDRDFTHSRAKPPGTSLISLPRQIFTATASLRSSRPAGGGSRWTPRARRPSVVLGSGASSARRRGHMVAPSCSVGHMGGTLRHIPPVPLLILD